MVIVRGLCIYAIKEEFNFPDDRWAKWITEPALELRRPKKGMQ